MQIEDKELWACALHVEHPHDDDGPKFIAERIGALALAGDIEGVATWRAIAFKLDAVGRANDT